MTLPANTLDVWTLATEGDKLKALASFSGMPAQRSISPEQAKVVDASYFLALDGVTKYGLTVAVQAILRGSLGHAFFPSPPELRMQCDKAMTWHEREAERIRRREREAAEQHTEWTPPTEAEKERAHKVYAEFCAGYDKTSTEETLKLDPELVKLVPDNPKSMARQRMGAKA